jgi:hypothetical protein
VIFVKSVTTPASKVASSPLVTPWDLVQGMIYKVEIMFPPGSLGLCGVSINNANHRLYPADDSEWFLGDNISISFDDEYMFTSETKQLELHTYNLDTVFSHLVQVRLGIVADTAFIQSRFGYAKLDALILQLSSLNSLLLMQNVASGKYSTDQVAKL